MPEHDISFPEPRRYYRREIVFHTLPVFVATGALAVGMGAFLKALDVGVDEGERIDVELAARSIPNPDLELVDAANYRMTLRESVASNAQDLGIWEEPLNTDAAQNILDQKSTYDTAHNVLWDQSGKVEVVRRYKYVSAGVLSLVLLERWGL